jgi:hypothetical protein
MTLPAALLAHLSQDVQDVLLTSIKPRLNAYMTMTDGATRARPNPDGSFTYPDETMMTDITLFWTLFNDVNAAFKSKVQIEAAIVADPILENAFRGLFAKGEFWYSPRKGVGNLQQMKSIAASEYETIWRTFRNGFAHFNWRYENLSALDYWTKQGWDIAGAIASFGLDGRKADNYLAYIADGMNWKPSAMWQLKDLRIVVTPTVELRYSLHLFLNYLLNGKNEGIFGPV